MPTSRYRATTRGVVTMQSIDWKNAWYPIKDVTYLNFAAHAAIPRVALNVVQASVAAKRRPHIVDDQSFFSVAGSLRQTLATLIGASQDGIALTSGAGAGLAKIACSASGASMPAVQSTSERGCPKRGPSEEYKSG